MKRYVTVNGVRYLIRGPWTVEELKQQYASFQQKYPSSKLDFERWLVERGKVYFSMKALAPPILRTKARKRGTCKRGERSDLTGCTPASGEGGGKKPGRKPPQPKESQSGLFKEPWQMTREEFDEAHLVHGTNIMEGSDFDYVEPQIGEFTREMYSGAGEGTFEELGGKPLAYFKPTNQISKIVQYATGVAIYPKKGEPYILITDKPDDALRVTENGLYDFEGNLVSQEIPLGAEDGDIISENGASVLHKIKFAEFRASGARDAHEFYVMNALRSGKPVSPEVLADYPELTPPQREERPKSQRRSALTHPKMKQQQSKSVRSDLKEEVAAAERRYVSALMQFGPNNMTTDRALFHYNDLKEKWKQQTGKDWSKKKSFSAQTKDRGQPCEQGEAASRTGCIPASGGPSFQPNSERDSPTSRTTPSQRTEQAEPAAPVDTPASGSASKPTEEQRKQSRLEYAKVGVFSKAFKAWFGDFENDPANASKVVTKSGTPAQTGAGELKQDGPKLVFHGTPHGSFNKFSEEMLKDPDALIYGPGFYFTEDPTEAEHYAKPEEYERRHGEGTAKKSPFVLRAYLNVRKPFDLDKGSIKSTDLPEDQRKILRAAVLQYTMANLGAAEARETAKEFDRGDLTYSYNELVRSYGLSKTKLNDTLKKLGHDGMTVMSKDVGFGGRHWVIFDTSQAKSVDNEGTFDPAEGFGKGMEPDEVKLAQPREGGHADLMDYLRSAYPSNWQNIVQTIKRRDLWDDFRLSSGMLNTRAIDRFLREIGVLDERNEIAKSLDGWSTKAIYGFDDELDALDKSMHPPRMKDSYFADCERDDEGHCLPKGEAGSESKQEEKPKTGADDEPKTKKGGRIDPEELEWAIDNEAMADEVREQLDSKNIAKFDRLLAKLRNRANEPMKQPDPSAVPDYVGQPIKTEVKPKVSVILSTKSGETLRSLTNDQLDSIVNYTDNLFKPLNKRMRGCPPEFDCLEDDYRQHWENIETAIEANGKFEEPVTVYRSLSLNSDIVKGLIEAAKAKQESGDAYQMPSLTSTSVSASHAASFGTGVLFHIRARSGLYVESVTVHEYEYELIQSAKIQYRVVAVAQAEVGDLGKKDVIYLEEIEP